MIRSVVLLLLLAAAPLAAATRYVDSAANGANNGTSWTDAWETAGAISWASLAAGDVVYFRPGTYGTVTIGKSGSAATVGGRIWLVSTSYLGDARPIVTSFENANSGYDYVGVVGFEITGSATAFNFNGNNQSVNGWMIYDHVVHDMTGGGVVFDKEGPVSSYNTIRLVTFQDLGTTNTASGLNVQLAGHYNIAEYITAGRGNDRTRLFGDYNVVRHWYGSAMLPADLVGGDPHIDEMQTWDPDVTAYPKVRNLVEAFWSYRNECSHSHGMNVQDANDDRSDFGGLLWRFCLFDRHGSLPGAEFQSYDDVRSYNNLFIDAYQRTTGTLTWQPGMWIRTGSDNHRYLNNSFVRAAGNQRTFDISGSTDISANYTHTHGQAAPGTGSNNITGDPLHTSPPNDYMPAANSPYVTNAASPHTLANGSGSNSTALVVDDSLMLSAGNGIVDGDLISIGGGPWVRITAINDTTKTVTLATADTWSDNDPVIVFGGGDWGPLEYRAGGYALDGSGTLSNPSGNNWVVTVADSDLVRGVVFREDGIPRDPDWDAPYQYTSSGGVVTADILKRHVSQTPWVAATQSEGDTVPPSVSSVAINSAGTALTVTLVEATTRTAGTPTLSLSGGACTATYSSGSGSTALVFTLSRTVGSHETGTASCALSANQWEDAAGNDAVSWGPVTVANSSTQDTVAPTLSSATINTAGTAITLAFTEAVTRASGTPTVALSGGACTLTYSSGSGTAAHVYSLSRTVTAGDSGTLAATPGADGWQDAAGNDVATISGFTVTNNSTQQTPVSISPPAHPILLLAP